MRERDDICEAVIRGLTARPLAELGEAKYQFFGIEGESPKQYDLSLELIHRLRRRKVPVQPVSAARWGRYEGETLVDSEHSEHGVMYFIVWIEKRSASQADVTVHAWPGLMHGGLAVSCRLAFEKGAWFPTRIVPEGGLGCLETRRRCTAT